MRHIYIIIGTFILMSTTSVAQIGINTENLVPEAIFQVDPLGNSMSDGTRLADDMVVTSANTSSAIGVGLGEKVSTGVQLGLNSNNKALKINEVKLQTLTDIVTVPNPRAGMLVYNTTAVASEEVEIGWYYFDGAKWNRILKAVADPVFKNEYTIPNKGFEYIIPAVNYSDAVAGIYSDAIKIPFMNVATTQIKAPADGTYVFALRLYLYLPAKGTAVAENYNTQAEFYVFMVSKTQNKVLDKALFSFPIGQGQFITRYNYSYRLVMGTPLDNNEEVEFYIGRGQSAVFDDWPLYIRILSSSDPLVKSAARTSMVFWKL